jgi:hypothetical protein
MDENIPNPSTTPLDGPCFFYQLSRELRDMVYEYALSVPEGVLMEIRHIGGSNDEDGDSDSVLVPSIIRNGRVLGEVNQLRYVSQQLRLETEGIVLRVNDVHFDTPRPEPPQHVLRRLQYSLLPPPEPQHPPSSRRLTHVKSSGSPR